MAKNEYGATSGAPHLIRIEKFIESPAQDAELGAWHATFVRRWGVIWGCLYARKTQENRHVQFQLQLVLKKASVCIALPNYTYALLI